MTTTGEYAVAAVLPSAWKSIMYRAMASYIVSKIFMDAVQTPIQSTDTSFVRASLKGSRFYAVPVIPAREPVSLVNLTMV